MPRNDDEPTVASPGRQGKQRALALQRAMAEQADRSHGVVARRHLIAIGYSSNQVDALVAAGWLHPIHRGVYHVGTPTPTRLGRHKAATLAFGERTAVSHRHAPVLAGLLADRGDPIVVTSSTGNSGWHDGVLVHESRRLRAADIVRVQGIAAVKLEWAMVDVAGTDPAEFERLFNAADRKRLIDPLALAGQLRRGRTGSALVRDRMASYSEPTLTESELEELFLTTVRDAGDIPLPTPQSSPLARRPQRIDFAWPGPRVAVEIDSRVWHAIQASWGEDHERDLALRLAGWTPLRYTHRQLTATPALVLDDLRAALGARA